MPTQPPSSNGGDTLQEALARLHVIVLDGLSHGHFDCSVTSVVIQGNKRRLMINAGKSYQFVIAEDDARRP